MTENEIAARNKKIGHAITWIILLVLFICFIFPFLMVIVNVFKDKSDITRDPLSLIGATKGFTLQNFPEAMNKMNFWSVFGNSLIITVCATILTIIVSSMTAFVIVRNGRWKVCTLVFSLMIASMVIPFQVLMVPLVSVYGGTLGVLNHRLTLILMHVGFSVSMAMFMFHGAIKTNIPLELEEAATIDGCSRCVPAAQAHGGDGRHHQRDGLLERLPAPQPCADEEEPVHHPHRDPGVLRYIFDGHRPGHGGAAAGHAADPDPLCVPAALHRARRHRRRGQGLIWTERITFPAPGWGWGNLFGGSSHVETDF